MGIDPELRARADAVAASRERVRCLSQQGWADHSLRTHEHDITREWYLTASGGFLEAVWELPDLVRERNAGGVEAAITYLETAPRCFRSGYVAERIMRRLSRQALTDDQRSRLTSVVLAETVQRQSRGWRDIGALGGAIWNQDLRAALISLASRGGVQGHRAARITSAAEEWRRSTSA